MSKQIPHLLTGHCPYLNSKHRVIAVYLETKPLGSNQPHYKVIEMECDHSDKCGYGNNSEVSENSFSCPIVLAAPKHPPGIGLG